MYNHNHYNGKDYEIVKQFSLKNGEVFNLNLEENCVLFKNNKVILESGLQKEVLLNRQGNYKLIGSVLEEC